MADKPTAYINEDGKIVLTAFNEKNDDWMKSLNGYKNEIKLHDDLEKKEKEKHKHS